MNTSLAKTSVAQDNAALNQPRACARITRSLSFPDPSLRETERRSMSSRPGGSGAGFGRVLQKQDRTGLRDLI